MGAAGSCPRAQAGWEIRIITRRLPRAERRWQVGVLLVYCHPSGTFGNRELSPCCGTAAGGRGDARGFFFPCWNHIIAVAAAAVMPFWVQIEAFCPFS